MRQAQYDEMLRVSFAGVPAKMTTHRAAFDEVGLYDEQLGLP